MSLLATFPTLTHDWLKHEHDPRLHRRQVVIKSGSGDLITGTVMAEITAAGANKGKLVPYNPAAEDGSQNATEILWGRYDASAADVPGVTVTGFAEIAALHLTWGAGVTLQAHKDAALAALALKFIQTRKLA